MNILMIKHNVYSYVCAFVACIQYMCVCVRVRACVYVCVCACACVCFIIQHIVGIKNIILYNTSVDPLPEFFI